MQCTSGLVITLRCCTYTMASSMECRALSIDHGGRQDGVHQSALILQEQVRSGTLIAQVVSC
jgi:hypothetical protein